MVEERVECIELHATAWYCMNLYGIVGHCMVSDGVWWTGGLSA